MFSNTFPEYGDRNWKTHTTRTLGVLLQTVLKVICLLDQLIEFNTNTNNWLYGVFFMLKKALRQCVDQRLPLSAKFCAPCKDGK